jgi:cell division septation protein DedD
MLRNSDGETEILLGNKQLLGLFVVVVCLLGIAFTGGYKLGKGSNKTLVAAPTTATSTEDTSGASTGTGGGLTQQLPGDSGATSSTSASGAQTATAAPPAAHSAADEDAAREMPKQSGTKATAVPVSRTKTHREEARDLEAGGPTPRPVDAPVHESANFAPQAGQMFLQVAAVTRDEAEGVAEVLRKKGFRAHAVPKPGSTKVYRVIIGPVRDASDLNNTRAQLRNNAGFRDVIVQRY